MGSRQNAIERVTDRMQRGEITAAEANVQAVQMEGVRIIRGSLPREVRSALNAAVKAGELGHIKKDGLRPECYHHKNGRARALEERERIFRESLERVQNTFS